MPKTAITGPRYPRSPRLPAYDGTIYLYFKRKEDILIRLFQEKLGELVGKFHESVEGTTDAVEALRTVCSIHFSELESNPELAYVTQIELRQSDLSCARKSAARSSHISY